MYNREFTRLLKKWVIRMKPLMLILPVLVVILLFGGIHGEDHQNNPYGITNIYQFGDSLSDTGNIIRDNPRGAGSNYGKVPYGQTFFHRPTGRCSDGLLMVDYFARYFKLPLLDPYLKKDGDFSHGVNFAVAGSTALDVSTLASKNVDVSLTNSSLSVQLQWFKSHLKSECDGSSDCKKKLRNALFLMGEIGGNDVNDALFQKNGITDTSKLVPPVIQAIKNAVEELIDIGAIRVIVPGNFPIGCTPVYLSGFKKNDSKMYDELKCLKDLNGFAKSQNDQLQDMIKDLQKKYPHVAIVYGDYFHAYRRIIKSASKLGFDKNSTMKACCGGGDNAYNFNWGKMCGFNGVKACSKPETHISWDGIHLTSHAYQHMADSLLKQITDGISNVKYSSGNRSKVSQKLTFVVPIFSFSVLNKYSVSFLTGTRIRSFVYLIIVMVLCSFNSR